LTIRLDIVKTKKIFIINKIKLNSFEYKEYKKEALLKTQRSYKMILERKIVWAAMAIMLLCSFGTVSKANADAAPGEGFYVGAFMGHGTGVIQGKSTILGNGEGGTTATTFETDRGGLGLAGIQGGGWLGWGMKTADDLYFGIDVSMAGSDEKIELSSSRSISADNQDSLTSASAKRNWVGGGGLRVGYYVNKDTLFALSGGVAVSQFDVTIGSGSETYYAGGPQIGASIESNLTKLDPNLALRLDFVYTDYLTADINGQDSTSANSTGTSTTNNDSELTGSDQAGRIGITYRF
jgi:hypothetical protein